MKSTQEAIVTVESLAQTGEGIARMDGRKVLLPGTLPGERVRVRLPSDGSNVAHVLSIEERSLLRLEPRCIVAERCGCCTWQHAPSEVQREARLTVLRRALPVSLRQKPVEYVPAPEPYGYRTRARLAWTTQRGVVQVGFRARSSHQVVDIHACPVLIPALESALGPLHDCLGSVSERGEVSIALGTGRRPVASLHPHTVPCPAGFEVPARLVNAGFAGAALWVPGSDVPTTAGDPRPVVRGGDGEPLWLAPDGFSQANEVLNAALAERVATEARAAGATVLELYAGAGNFTVLLARTARRVIAVEADRAATAALTANLEARGLANVAVLTDDAARIVSERRADVVVLDPPRTGAREVAETLARRPPDRLVYVSCDPPTLGRDLGILTTAMEVEALYAFEMFPQTPHLEVVAVARRRRSAGSGTRRSAC